MERSLVIGIIEDPEHHHDWALIKAFLEPAAKMGNVPLLGEWHTVWGVYDAGELLAAATARLTWDGHGEIILCGGKGAKDWAGELSGLIGRWMRDEGMEAIHIYGRDGWKKLLPEWTTTKLENGVTAFERLLA